MLRPAEDIALFCAEMAAWPGPGELKDWQQGQLDWLEANDDCRRDILEKLYDEGPLPSRELPDTTLLPGESSGWNNDRSRRMLLELMVKRGEVASAGCEGRERLWDLAERVYPDDPVVPLDGRVALHSPLDRPVFDRKQMAEIFEFDYQLEKYKPAAERRWGYWAMPILYDDRLVGKLDATADRDPG